MDALRASLRDLEDADRLGLLAPAGSRLRAAIARRVAGMRRPP
jgi:hypothetical protein